MRWKVNDSVPCELLWSLVSHPTRRLSAWRLPLFVFPEGFVLEATEVEYGRRTSVSAFRSWRRALLACDRSPD